MELIVIVDINGQRLESAVTLARLTEVAAVRKVILSGSRGILDAWTQRLERNISNTAILEVLAPVGRRDESTVLLAGHAISTLLTKPETKDFQWLVISRREGFQALCEQLHGFGATQTQWAAALTHDLTRRIVGGEEGAGSAIREVAVGMLARNQNQPVLIGALANTLTELLPELRKPEDREQLFGVRKFKAICVAVGLKVKGDYILPSKVD